MRKYRSDIYSLGCVLYEVLTGDPPHQAETPIGLMHKHVAETPRGIDKAGQFPEGMSAIVSRAMSKSCDQRYQSMAEFAADLVLVTNGRGDKIELAAIAANSKPASSKIATVSALALGSLLCALLAISGVLQKQNDKWKSTFESPLGTCVGHSLLDRIQVQFWPVARRIKYYSKWIALHEKDSTSFNSAVAQLYLAVDLMSQGREMNSNLVTLTRLYPQLLDTRLFLESRTCFDCSGGRLASISMEFIDGTPLNKIIPVTQTRALRNRSFTCFDCPETFPFRP